MYVNNICKYNVYTYNVSCMSMYEFIMYVCIYIYISHYTHSLHQSLDRMIQYVSISLHVYVDMYTACVVSRCL